MPWTYAIDATKTRRTMYDVTWNALSLGGLIKVDLAGLKPLLAPVKIGSFGGVQVDARVVGLADGAMVTVTVSELTRAMLEKAMPWFTGTTSVAAIPLMPPQNTLLAQYAQELLIHPRDQSGQLEDVQLYKTVPMQGFNLSRDGTKDDNWDLQFLVLPDVSKLPANMYGTIKAST